MKTIMINLTDHLYDMIKTMFSQIKNDIEIGVILEALMATIGEMESTYPCINSILYRNLNQAIQIYEMERKKDET
jgi:hypothetical protein